MREFIIGDLHGSIDLLNKILLEVDFDLNEDIMYSVGDLIDRGTDSMRCLRLLKEPWFKAVMGNHEEFLIRSIIHGDQPFLWLQNGGRWHLEEDQDELLELAKLAEQLPYAITIGDIGICHAQPPTDDWNDVYNLTEYHKDTMIWSRSMINGYSKFERIKNIKHTYHGHSIIAEPMTIGNSTFIDTGAYTSGKLTYVELTDDDN